MKKFLKILLGLFVIVILALAAVFYFTADMVTVADDFFKAVKSKDAVKAYSYLSDDFKAQTPQGALDDFLSKSGLTGFKSASWGERSISGSRGELTGSINTESGGVVPIKISFVKGDSGWKIFYIEKPAAGVQETPSSKQMPSEANMVTVADNFFRAVKSNDAAKTYSYLSDEFKAQTPKGALEDFLSKSGLTGYKSASWGEQSISGSRGELTASINTESAGVVPIKIIFAKSDSGWKIYSIEKPAAAVQETPPSRQMPSETDMVKMVAETMHTFAVAVNEKSMARLHGYSAGVMQRQYSVQKLDEAFGSFYNLGVDLTVLDNYSPAFDDKPKVNDEGILIIRGLYPTKPSQVYFELGYAYEGLGWKLAGISVKIK